MRRKWNRFVAGLLCIIMLATMLPMEVLAAGSGKALPQALPFEDVRSSDWFAKAVEYVYSHNLFSGTSATTFSPNAPITREQMAAMLFRYAMYDGLTAVALSENLISFPDEQQLSGWAMSAMQWAVGAGIITGTPDGALAPQKNATRAQAAAMLARYLRN